MNAPLTYEECRAWAEQFGNTPWNMLALSTASAKQPGPMRVMKALFDEVERLNDVLKLAEGVTLVHDIETDDDPESFADWTGFDRIDCKACLFNVARGKKDRRDPAKVSAG